MNITNEYRSIIKKIRATDKIIPYRNPRDMKFGTLHIEEKSEYFDITGIDKKNGNRIRFARVVPQKRKYKPLFVWSDDLDD